MKLLQLVRIGGVTGVVTGTGGYRGLLGALVLGPHKGWGWVLWVTVSLCPLSVPSQCPCVPHDVRVSPGCAQGCPPVPHVSPTMSLCPLSDTLWVSGCPLGVPHNVPVPPMCVPVSPGCPFMMSVCPLSVPVGCLLCPLRVSLCPLVSPGVSPCLQGLCHSLSVPFGCPVPWVSPTSVHVSPTMSVCPLDVPIDVPVPPMGVPVSPGCPFVMSICPP